MTNGLVVMTPSSVATTGGSSTATINSDGSVTFGSCETLSLNGVFTSDYDNYMIVMSVSATVGNLIRARLRLSGTDSTATTDYNTQFIRADSTTVSGNRSTITGYWWFASVGGGTGRDGYSCHVFGPYLSQPTAYRSVSAESTSGARVYDFAGTHELSTAYDGLTLIHASNDFSGLLTVFGFNQ